MKTILIYSSITGNTRKVARSIMEVMPADTTIYPVVSAPAPAPYDLLALGFWVDKGAPDSDMSAYMARVKNKTVILFGTLGARPESEHGRQALHRTKSLLAGNRILVSFLCQGRIDFGLLHKMARLAATGDQRHPMTPERSARIKNAQAHPDAQDLQNARDAVRGMLEKLPYLPKT